MLFLFAKSPILTAMAGCGLQAPLTALSTPCFPNPVLPFVICPCPGLDPGHIRGSANMPFMDFLTEDGLEKSPEMLRAMFEDKKVDLAKPIIATCRKGVTACHIALAAYLCGKPDVAIYDGSWSEWFRRAPPETRVSQWNDRKA